MYGKGYDKERSVRFNYFVRREVWKCRRKRERKKSEIAKIWRN
jgi:hypothetical protein